MSFDGLLVTARHLVNGATIIREAGFKRIDDYHVELANHDVTLAEGAPSESFVDDDSRGTFHDASEWNRLHPGRHATPALFCAPRVESGSELEAIRRRLGGTARLKGSGSGAWR